MKRLLTFATLILFLSTYASGGSGLFDAFAIVNGSFYDLGVNTANPNFSGANIGTFNTGNQLKLGGQLKTWKDNSTDVFGGSIFYMIYPVGNRPTSPVFTEITYGFQANLGGNNNQQWGTDVNGSNTTDRSVDIFNGLSLPAGDYTLEVYARSSTNGINAATNYFDNNGGNNYLASFTLATPLPVAFTGIQAKPIGNQTDVTWQTATETNNAYFNIERSTDSRRWQTLGRVAGAGTTQETQNYTYTDKAPALGTNYYRIQQVDYDGASSYSPIVSAQWKGGAAARLFPNPTATTVRVDLMTGEETPVTLSVYDMLGRLVLQHNAPAATDLNVGHLPAGAYLLQATHNGTVLLSERLMVE